MYRTEEHFRWGRYLPLCAVLFVLFSVLFIPMARASTIVPGNLQNYGGSAQTYAYLSQAVTLVPADSYHRQGYGVRVAQPIPSTTSASGISFRIFYNGNNCLGSDTASAGGFAGDKGPGEVATGDIRFDACDAIAGGNDASQIDVKKLGLQLLTNDATPVLIKTYGYGDGLPDPDASPGAFPSPGAEPVDPSDPVTGDPGSCSGWNPFVYIKCALKWAFVPGDGAMNQWTTFRGNAESKPPLSFIVGGSKYIAPFITAEKNNPDCNANNRQQDTRDAGLDGCHVVVRDNHGASFDFLGTMGDFMQQEGQFSGVQWGRYLYGVETVMIWVPVMFWVWSRIGKSFGSKEEE